MIKFRVRWALFSSSLFVSVVMILTMLVRPTFSEESPFTYETISVPAGTFELFIPVEMPTGIEYLQKKITFSHAFEIGKYEVNNAQWNKCFHAGGCNQEAEVLEGELDSHPVARSNWHDAYQFSQWLTAQSGSVYRLPTEAEWAYAAYVGQNHKAAEVSYNYSGASLIPKVVRRTSPAGTSGQNAWGFADSNGNVWEWTLTCWYGSAENMLADRLVVELNNPNYCVTRIAMGESRAHIPDFIKDTYSGGCATLRPAANLGFRLVRERKRG